MRFARVFIATAAVFLVGCNLPVPRVQAPAGGGATFGPPVASRAPAIVNPTSDHPSGATAKCRDGTFSFSAHRSGTCSHHQGVAVWYK